MRLLQPCLLALCGLLSLSAHAEVRLVAPVEAGIFATPERAAQPGEQVLLRSAQQIQPASEIPARLGVKFGLRLTLDGKRAEDTPLTLLYLTPGVVSPDGQRHDRYEVVQKLAPGSAQEVMAWEFSESWELVPGEWRFMVFQGDRKLADERFMVR